MNNRNRGGILVLFSTAAMFSALVLYTALPARQAAGDPAGKATQGSMPMKVKSAPRRPILFKGSTCGSAEAGKVMPLHLYIVSRKEKPNADRHSRADQRSKLASLDESVFLYAVLKAKYSGSLAYFTASDTVRIGRTALPGRLVKPWPLACQPTIRWYKVEPIHNSYSYVKRSNPIDYAETPFARGWRVRADVHPTHLGDQFKEVRSGIGIMRYKATLRLKDRQVSTPGREALSNGGISKKLHNITHRPHTGKVTDYAFELFNTPYIWGSMGYQVDGHVGVDCADLVVYALRRSGRKIDYTWSKGLVADRRRFAKIKDGRVRVGDILYHGRHVGMLHEENGNGKLDGADKVVHTLFHEPEVVTVQAFGWPEVVLRWRGASR